MSKKEKEVDKKSEASKKQLDAFVNYLVKKRYTNLEGVMSALGISKHSALVFLKTHVDSGLFVEVYDPDRKEKIYFYDEPGFYEPEELQDFLSDVEKERILRLISVDGITITELSREVYGGSQRPRNDFLRTFLEFYVERDLITLNGSNRYKLSPLGREVGLDEQSILTLDAIALENKAIVDSEQIVELGDSLSTVEEALIIDRKKKTITPIDITDLVADQDSLSLLFMCETLFGNQFTDVDFVKFVLAHSNPDFTFASGLVQGTFSGLQVDKVRVLAKEGGLNKIAAQFHYAGLLNQELESITRHRVINVQGDDDWDLGRNYAHLAQLAEGKVWRHGVNTSGLTAELTRRLNIVEFYRKWRIQWEIILPYMYRIGRSLLNKNEVFERIGIKKSEYRLIIEILVATRNDFGYPESYKKVVNIEALFGDIAGSKRIVSPDSVILWVGGREIQLIHNSAFSNITQYVDSLGPIEKIMRQLGARGTNIPWVIADAHQERLFGTYLQGSWIMNLPGLQNPELASGYRMKEFNTRVLSSKSLRQDRFRKEPVTPGAVNLELLADGRVRLRVLNNRVKEVIESQADLPETKEVVCILTDTQFGSITMVPEGVIKFLDYALYERNATRLWENGDIIHGYNYNQHMSENRPTRLVSVDSQKRFTIALQAPLITQAPELRDVAAWLGNHEWNTFDTERVGVNHLEFIEMWLNGFIEAQRLAGIPTKLKTARTVGRIRFMNTHNTHGGGEIANWPYFSDTVAGFKAAIMHKWQFKGGGRTPVDQQIRWLTNMATAADDIDVMFGGHYHSIWFAQVANKLLVQLGAAAGQSGFELIHGLMSTVMFTLVEFSNKDGITIEFIPWDFLKRYKLQSPAYAGKDDLLIRPERGTVEFAQGKFAPLIESMIDNVTFYLEV